MQALEQAHHEMQEATASTNQHNHSKQKHQLIKKKKNMAMIFGERKKSSKANLFNQGSQREIDNLSQLLMARRGEMERMRQNQSHREILQQHHHRH